MTRYSSLKNNNEYQLLDVDFAKRIAQEKQAKDRKRLNADARLLKIKLIVENTHIGHIFGLIVKAAKNLVSVGRVRQA